MKECKINQGEHAALYVAHSTSVESRQQNVNNCWEAIGRRHNIDQHKIVEYDQDRGVIIIKD